MKKLFYLLVLLLMSTVSFAKKINKQQYIAEWPAYEVTTLSVGQNGTKNLKVWGVGKTIEKAIEQAKKNAVHACLFRGCPRSATAMTTPAIFANQGSGKVALDNIEYFYDFFEVNNGYGGFVNLIIDNLPSGQDRREIKKGYKVAIYVQIMFDNLRQKMTDDGILKKASSGFSY